MTVSLATIVAIVLVPFALVGGRADAWIAQILVTTGDNPRVAALLIAAALAGDVLLPVPSSLVATAAGYLLGFARGMLASFVGLMVGSGVGYFFGRIALPRVRGEAIRMIAGRWGGWAIAITRPIPVLSETATLFAGSCRLPLRRFLAISALSNLWVAGSYAGAGAVSASWQAPWLALVVACGAPVLALGFVRWRRPVQSVSARPK